MEDGGRRMEREERAEVKKRKEDAVQRKDVIDSGYVQHLCRYIQRQMDLFDWCNMRAAGVPSFEEMKTEQKGGKEEGVRSREGTYSIIFAAVLAGGRVVTPTRYPLGTMLPSVCFEYL